MVKEGSLTASLNLLRQFCTISEPQQHYSHFTDEAGTQADLPCILITDYNESYLTSGLNNSNTY